jgi:hypothetical protein
MVALTQRNPRLLAIVVFFALLAILLLGVLWFEGSQLLNGFWHSIHASGIAVVSRHP